MPVIWALLSNRVTNTYVTFFNHILSNFGNFTPKIVISDFELALGSAFQTVFPTIKLMECYFHYAQVRKKKYGANRRLRIERRFLGIRPKKALSRCPAEEGVISESVRRRRYHRVCPKKALSHTQIFLAQI